MPLHPDELAYLQKHEAKLKAADKKIDAAIAELSKARQKLLAKPPAGVPPELLEPYLKNQAGMTRSVGYLDRYFADMKRDARDYLGAVKRTVEQGR
jgi:hypothetical protein